MLPAFFLVMTVLVNGTDRATIHTFAAGAIGEEETIGPVIKIGPGGRLNVYFGNYRSHPHGFALCGNEPVA